MKAAASPTMSVPNKIGFVRRFPEDSWYCFIADKDLGGHWDTKKGKKGTLAL